ncbi:MAG: metallophosphoesterase family protein [Deltaproteobacteria bacterium]|nr:metallophosphoesterase family protein [Deltaproteobacteria bacterium]
MRICIISDLHANLEALYALPQSYDELWVLGDLVNYGPDPAAVLEFVRSHASLVIRGNHDHAVGFAADCGCSPRFLTMAEATRDYTIATLSDRDKQYLRQLPTSARRQIEETTFFLCHASPANLLYEYRPPDSPLWDGAEEASRGANVILAGHSHLQFSRRCGERIVINPGSLGQSKMGNPFARYAVWEDGHFELRACEYPVETTARKITAMPVPDEVKRDLIDVLRTGTVP